MTIQDGNAERRNLTVLAFMIVVYYLGGGQPIGNEIKLAMVSVKFTNPTSLKITLWVVLFWFAYRHWVANRAEHLAVMRTAKSALQIRRMALWLLSSSPQKDKLLNTESTIVKGGFDDVKGKTLSRVDYFLHVSDNAPKVTFTRESHKWHILYFNLLIHITLFFKQRYLLDFWAPFLLTALAVFFAIVNQ